MVWVEIPGLVRWICHEAYHQGELHEDSRKYTAFSTPWSLFEWIRIPYVIMNAPPGFQRFVNNCLAEHLDRICSAYT